jgi:hypothetical protein
MGSAGSTLLTDEQKIVISQSLKQQYDYCLALGMEPELINDTLTTDYHKNIQKLYPDYVIPDFEKHGVVAAVKRRNSKQNVLSSQPGSRRGSFDAQPQQQKPIVRRRSGDDLKNYKSPTAASLAPKVVTNAPVRKGARRRSFDSPLKPVERSNLVLNNLMEINEPPPTIPEHLSPTDPETAPMPQEPQAAVDSWDSITEMPYCTTCKKIILGYL